MIKPSYCQTYTYNYGTDTSSVAYYSKILSNGDIILLSDNYETYSDANSTLFEGPNSFGTGLIRISNGAIVWKKSYSTNAIMGSSSAHLAGLLPTKKFLALNDSSIILPFNTFYNYTSCDTINTTITGTSYPSVYQINLNNGNSSNLKTFNEDNLCSYNNLLFLQPNSNNTYKDIFRNHRTKKTYLEIRDSSFNRLSLDTINHTFNINNPFENSFIQSLIPFNNNLISQSLDYIIIYDSLGNKIDSILKNSIGSKIMDFDNDWTVCLTSDYQINNSTLSTYNLNNNNWYQISFPNIIITDVLVKDEQIYFVANNNEATFIYTSDMEFTDLKYSCLNSNKNIKINNIQIDQNNTYFVAVGTIDSILANIRYPNKIYVQKGLISSINTNYTNINKIGDSKVKIFPNPVNTYLNLYFEDKSKIKDIKLISPLGKVVFNQSTKNSAIIINVNDFPNGIYLVKVNTQIEKLLINH